SSGWRNERSNPQRREPCRPAGPAVHQVRIRNQPTDGENARPRSTQRVAVARRRGDRVKRRTFITLLGGAVGWPLAGRAQQSERMPVVGLLHPTSLDAVSSRLRAFHQGLKETGFVEGENVAIAYRFAENQINQLPELAADLARRQVAVIVAVTTLAA